MAGSKGAHNHLFQWHSLLRVCVPCGIETGIYPKGLLIGTSSLICLQCGVLCQVRGNFHTRLCSECAPDHTMQQIKRRWWREERQLKLYQKYIDGVEKGRERRRLKGERLRREKGITSPVREVARSRSAKVLVGSFTGFTVRDEYPRYYYGTLG
jgi:hypothetical protein